jgi:hypothetical protein
MSIAIPRRSFVEKLGLGAGAALLSPIAQTLVQEAHGQAPTRKIAVFFVVGNAINWDYNFTPPEFRAPDLNYPVLDGPTEFTWPKMIEPLLPWRARTLLVDGLANVPRTGSHGHSSGYATLSCFPAAHGMSNDGGGPPGGITIDQYLAERLGGTTRRKSVLYGVSQKPDAQLARIFAAARERPEPHVQSPSLLWSDLFGTLVSDGSGVNKGLTRQRVLLDTLRADIKRMQGAFAATERRKLDVYLGALEDFEKRERAAAGLTCNVTTPQPSATAPRSVEDRLESMHEMGVLALTCGLTNVLGISLGGGNAHDYFPTFTKISAGTRWEKGGIQGHDLGHQPRDTQGPGMDLVHGFATGLIARLAHALSQVKVGDATLFDNTVVVYTSDCGEQHHANHQRNPTVIVGTAGGKLKTGGRFLRYPKRGSRGYRSMADLFCTVATACGVPTNDFGKGGNEPVSGPLPEILG